MQIDKSPIRHTRKPDPNEEPLDRTKRIIRELGLKVTLQRINILNEVINGHSHFTAQSIFECVAKKYPEIGFATVYRFLRELSQNGYVTEVRMGGLPARYEWANKSHHDHLTCVNCGKIQEFENPQIENLQIEIAENFGFKLTDHILELYGLCPKCSHKEGELPARTTLSPQKIDI